MSLVAFAIVLVVVTTGWERHEADEGTAAHLFQLLIALQIPAVALFLITARSRRLAAMAKPLALQLGALALAVGSLAYFRL
ncbi:MAG TPA: hypothetical protein VHT03_12390 [Rhizomicrobium sp.]|nr:hypothetical protein [Rhizomicrobium sp.]